MSHTIWTINGYNKMTWNEWNGHSENQFQEGTVWSFFRRVAGKKKVIYIDMINDIFKITMTLLERHEFNQKFWNHIYCFANDVIFFGWDMERRTYIAWILIHKF